MSRLAAVLVLTLVLALGWESARRETEPYRTSTRHSATAAHPTAGAKFGELSSPPSLQGGFAISERQGTSEGPAGLDMTSAAASRSLQARPLGFPLPGDPRRAFSPLGGAPASIPLALEIAAPRGTPVFAVEGGRVLEVGFDSTRGIEVWIADPTRRFVYVYCSLDRPVANLRTGSTVTRGSRLGYSGDSGDASAPGAYRLRLQILHVSQPSDWWQGTNLDAAAILRAAILR